MADSRVNVVGPGGKVVSIPEANIELAQERGWRLQTPEEAHETNLQLEYGSGAGNALAAGALGALRGGTLGLSDALLTGSGMLERETVDALRRYNPGSSIAGELAGVVAPALLSGGTGAAGAAARLTGPGLATRAGAAATSVVGGASERALVKALAGGAGLATEGALYGAGQMVTEASLGDAPLAAERIAAHIGSSALLGVAGGATLSLLGKGVSRTGRAIGKKLGGKAGVQAKLDDLADDFTIDSFGLTGSNAKAIQRNANNPEALKDIADQVRAYRFPDGKGILDAGLTGATAEELTERLGRAVNIEGKRIREAIVKADDHMRNLGESINLAGFFDRVDSEIIDPLLVSDLESLRSAGKRLAAELKPLRSKVEAGETYGLKDLWDKRRIFDRIIRGGNKVGKGVRLVPEHAEELQRARTMLEELITGEMDRLAPREIAAQYTASKTAYSRLRGLYDEAIKRQPIIQQNRRISLTDYLSLIAGSVVAGPYGVGAVLANKFIRERSSPIMAQLFASASKASTASAGAVDKAVSRIATGAAAARRARNPALMHILQRVNYSDEAKDTPADRNEAFRERVGELALLAQNPTILADRMSERFGPVMEAAPTVSIALHDVAARAAAFLHAKAPKNPSAPSLGKVAQWKPSPSEIAQFGRFVQAIDDPVGVLDALADGTVSGDAVEAIKAVYPAMWDDFARQLVEKLANVEISYADRNQLSAFLGVPTDAAHGLDFVAAIQKTYAALPSPQEGGGTAVRKPDLDKLNVSQSYMPRMDSVAQRLG